MKITAEPSFCRSKQTEPIRTLAGIGVAFLLLPLPLIAQMPAIAPEPLYEIGTSTVDESDQLGRVVDVVLLPGGGVAILDALPGVLRLYDSEGRLVRDLGGPGEGPGEFTDPIDVALIEGRLVVLERDGRTNAFELDGSLVDTDRILPTGLTSDGFNPLPARLLPDGRVLFEAREGLFGKVTDEYRQSAILAIGGSEPVTLGTFPADTVRATGSNPIVPRPYLPADRLLIAAAADQVVVLDPHLTLTVIDLNGEILLERRVDFPEPEVSELDINEARELLLGPLTDANDRRVVGEWLDGMPVADRAPPVRSLLLSERGIWLELWRRADGCSRWALMGLDGAGSVEVLGPPGLEVVDVDAGRVAGIMVDALGIQRVRVHEITESRHPLQACGAHARSPGS